MSLAGLQSFFAASAGVAGALIGLLFVAVSVAQDRLAAENAAQAHRVRAAAALTAFINALTVSLFALLPDERIGWPASVMAIIGLVFVITALLSLLRIRYSQPGELRDAAFLLGLVATFAAQLVFGVVTILNPHDTSDYRSLAMLVIVCFLIGISRSWELIGGPSMALRTEIRAILSARDREGS